MTDNIILTLEILEKLFFQKPLFGTTNTLKVDTKMSKENHYIFITVM